MAGFVLLTVLVVGWGLFIFFNLNNQKKKYRVIGMKWLPPGSRIGGYVVKMYPEKQAFTAKLDLTDSSNDLNNLTYGYAKFVVFFAAWQIFYFSNGKAEADQSAPLRSALHDLLANKQVESWRLVEWDLYENATFRRQGALFQNALSPDLLLGVDRDLLDYSMVETTRALVADMLRRDGSLTPEKPLGVTVGPQYLLVHHSLKDVLSAHDEFGPPASLEETFVRAANAWQKSFAAHGV